MDTDNARAVLSSSVTSARLTLFKTLESGNSAEPTLTTSRTSSTDTLATADSGPKENGKEVEFKEFWRKELCLKNRVGKTARKCPILGHSWL